MKALPLLLLLICMAGCASERALAPATPPSPARTAYFFKAEIFHRLPSGTHTFTVIGDTNLSGSVENAIYLAHVEHHLTNLNHSAVKISAKPQWLAFLLYEELPAITRSRDVPIHGFQRGHSYSHYGTAWGPRGPTTFQGTTHTPAHMAIVGHTTHTTTINRWRARLEIYDVGTDDGVRQLYDARFIVTANGGSMHRAIHLAITEIFGKFPGPETDKRERYLYD